ARDHGRRRALQRQHRRRGARARHQPVDVVLPHAQARPRAPPPHEGGRPRRGRRRDDMTAWSMVACGLVAAAACGGPTWVRSPGCAPPARSERLRTEGTAQYAKRGPVIAGGGLVVYIAEQPRWPPEALGHRVVAEGTLEETREATTIGGLDGDRSAGLETPAL